MRIGIGYDVHKLVEDRKLIIGGIEIPYERGLLGHSDADVLIHAIMDAILGALALRDIGYHFPDNDNKYKDIDSKVLLSKVYEIMKSKNYKIGNIDSVVACQAPKLASHIDDMRKTIANILKTDIENVSIKATTTERLGFVGRGQGISSEAVVLLERDDWKMKFFIDTANIDEIKEINSWGVLSGVTTNPSLIAKSGGVFEDVIKEISEIVDGDISAEVISTDLDGMLKEARELAKISDNIVIKIPMIEEGLKAVSILSKEGIRTNVTLIFSVSQAILAANAGATYVSPFMGRLDDIGESGLDLVADIAYIFKEYGYHTQIIAASIRHINHVEDVARTGADIGTIPYKIFKEMIKHNLTDAGLKKFLEDFKSVKTKEK